MEIQFTIKIGGSGGSAAVLKNENDDTIVQGVSLGRTSESADNPEKSAGEGGAGDPAGPGGGGPAGQVIVIGPIVINAAGASSAAGKGGAGDPLSPGGGRSER